MIRVYDFTCETCGLCIEAELAAEHAFESGHKMFKYIGVTKEGNE